jgi:hypothetical protein
MHYLTDNAPTSILELHNLLLPNFKHEEMKNREVR